MRENKIQIMKLYMQMKHYIHKLNLKKKYANMKLQKKDEWFFCLFNFYGFLYRVVLLHTHKQCISHDISHAHAMQSNFMQKNSVKSST